MSKRRAKGLTAGHVQEILDALAGRLSTRSLQITRLCLDRAIGHAEVRDLVGRNVAALVKAPAGRAGRPSKSLTLEQAQELPRACRPPAPAHHEHTAPPGPRRVEQLAQRRAFRETI